MNEESDHEQLFKISRPDQNLAVLFHEIYKSGKFVDVTLSCNDLQIRAHKLVLSACSPYFCELFDKISHPLHYPIIILKDMPAEDLRLIVDFMYLGEIRVTQEKLISVIKSAESLQINGLSTMEGFELDDAALWDQEFNFISCNNSNSSSQANYINNQETNNNRQRVKRKKGNNLNTPNIYSMSSHDEQHAPTPTNKGQKNRNLTTKGTVASANFNDNLIASGFSTTTIDGQPYDYNLDSDSLLQDNDESIRLLEQPFMTVGDNLSSSRNNLSQDMLLEGGEHNQTNNNTNVDSGQEESQIATLANSKASSEMNDADDKPHQCNICFRSFKEKANLKRHSQIHVTNRKKFACPECDKTFTWRDNLMRHLNSPAHNYKFRVNKAAKIKS